MMEQMTRTGRQSRTMRANSDLQPRDTFVTSTPLILLWVLSVTILLLVELRANREEKERGRLQTYL